MILIGGTSLNVEQLPMYEVMDYQIELGQPLAIKLKTVAKGPNCFNIYLHEDLRAELTITDDIYEKVVFYSSDDELLKLLERGGAEEEEDIFAEEVEVPEFEQPILKEEIKNEIKDSYETDKESENDDGESDAGESDAGESNDSSEIGDNKVENDEGSNSFYLPELEEVDTELPDVFLQIPNIGEDTDSLKVQLENKEKLIKQKESMIKDLQVQLEDAYKLQELQMLEIKDLYDKKIEEANLAITELKEKASGVQIDQESLNFLKFASYSKNYKAALREGFTDVERKSLGRLNSKFSIFACSSGDSYYSMMKQIRKYMDKFPNVVIVDFSNDYYLNTSYNLKTQYNSMDITKLKNNVNNEFDMLSIFKTLGGNTRIATTTLFNDISLLGVDWVDVLRKIDDYAGGTPVILLFNNINSFSVRYTVSKLATIGELYVFVKCAPIVLSALFGDIKFIPEDRVTIIALEYIEVVKTILSVISKTYNTKAFAHDVEWNKLGLK